MRKFIMEAGDFVWNKKYKLWIFLDLKWGFSFLICKRSAVLPNKLFNHIFVINYSSVEDETLVYLYI